MPRIPAPGGQTGETPWWVVWYEPLGTRAPGTAASRVLILQAASRSDITASSVGGAITRVDGPFKTQADAEKDAGKGPVPGTGGLTNVQASGGADVRFPKLPNPLGWLQDIAHWIGEAVAHFLDLYMWRSILWVALGAVLMILGIYLWLKQQGLVPKATPVPVPV